MKDNSQYDPYENTPQPKRGSNFSDFQAQTPKSVRASQDGLDEQITISSSQNYLKIALSELPLPEQLQWIPYFFDKDGTIKPFDHKVIKRLLLQERLDEATKAVAVIDNHRTDSHLLGIMATLTDRIATLTAQLSKNEMGDENG